MIPVVIGLTLCFRNRPSVQHLLWVVVLLKFVTPPIISLPVKLPSWIISSTDEYMESVVETQPNVFLEGPRVEPARGEPNDENSNDVADELVSLGSTGSTDLGRDRRTVLGQSTGPFWLLRLAAITWGTGTIVFAIRQFHRLQQNLRLISQFSQACPKLEEVVAHVAKKLGTQPLEVCIVPGNGTPFVWCLGKPKLIWPEGIVAEDSIRSTRLIIAHELSHVNRRDHWIAWIELAAGLIWWWNPLFWFVRKNIRVNSELACDALAFDQFPDDRGIYAEALLALSVSKPGGPPLVLAVGDGPRSSLERRISMMMHEDISGKLSLGGVLAAGLLAVAALPALSLGQENSQESKQRSPVYEERVTTPSATQADEKVARGKKTPLARQRQLDEELRIAAKSGNAKRMKDLIEQGADPNQFELGDGLPVIVDAIGSTDCVRTLVKHGANLKRRITFMGGFAGAGPWYGIMGEATALHYAVHRGSPDTVQYLLDVGMDPNATDIHGQTPLHVAIWTERMQRKTKDGINERQIENIKLLLRNDASIWFQDRDGATALDIASKANSPSQVLSILQERQQQLRRAFESARSAHGAATTNVSIGESFVFEASEAVHRFHVAKPDVCTVAPLDAKRLRVIAVSAGKTDVTF